MSPTITSESFLPYWRYLRIVTVVLLLWLNTATTAELTFAQPTATFTAPIEANGQDVTFEFRNTTKDALIVTVIYTGCGCMTSELGKRVYAPGEAGSLRVHVDFQNRTGAIRKVMRIKVKGEHDATETEQRLKIDGVALSPISLSDLTVSWANGEAVSTKEIVVTIKEGHRVSDLSIEVPTPNDLFAVAMVPSAAGGATLRMTPDVVDRTSVRLNNGRDVQQAYLLTYRYLPSGIVKKERFYAIIHR